MKKLYRHIKGNKFVMNESIFTTELYREDEVTGQEIEIQINVDYDYTNAGRGARERETGLQLEPDWESELVINTVTNANTNEELELTELEKENIMEKISDHIDQLHEPEEPDNRETEY